MRKAPAASPAECDGSAAAGRRSILVLRVRIVPAVFGIPEHPLETGSDAGTDKLHQPAAKRQGSRRWHFASLISCFLWPGALQARTGLPSPESIARQLLLRHKSSDSRLINVSPDWTDA